MIVVFFIAFLFMTGLTDAQYYSIDSNISFDFAQSVNGTGFFSSYRNVNMSDPLGNLQGVTGQDFSGMASKNLAHGSGKIKDNSRILAYSYYNETDLIPVENGIVLGDDVNITAFPSIGIQEDTDMVYNPSAVAVGSGYYARDRHPIGFLSLPEDRTYVKNLDTGSTLGNEIKYAKSFRKVLEAHVEYIDLANATMELNETIREGTVQIGALQLEELPTFRDIDNENGDVATVLSIKKSKPQIETDEIYIGSFHLNKKFILSASVITDDEDDYYEWIPCCYQGIEDVIGDDSQDDIMKGIFDCTCYKVLNEEKQPK